MTAHDDPEFFSEAEVYQALRWGMTDSEAAKLAKYMTDDPAVWETLPGLTFRDLGPSVGMYSDDMLLLLSLVSEEARRKVDQRLAERNLGKGLSEEDRARWEKRRSELRAQLVAAGELKE